ncbi:ribonuclease H-like domain-containing protein [Tanacetum coccineum]
MEKRLLALTRQRLNATTAIGEAEECLTNIALMANTSQGSSSSSSSDSEVHTCSKDCYQIGLESLEARIVVHEKNEAVYEENIEFLKYDVQVKDISIKDLKNQLEEALKEKDDLKLKLENFEESSKNLTKLINSQISAKDKTGLGYDGQMNESELNNIHMNESEVVHSVFNSRESDVDDNLVNDRFKIGEGFHAVPPPYTRNYMPPRPDLSFAGLDEYVFKSAVRKTTTSVPETETSISKTSKDIVEKPKTVRPSAPIIEEWDTDNDNDSVFRPKSDQTKPKFTKINFVKSGENVKSVNKENTHRQVEYPRKSQSPRGNRRNWNGMMTQKLGNGFEFIKKACFVCGSFNHLIKDCDFHDNKMVEKPVLNNKGRVTGQREIRPVWNNAQRVNHQNKLTHPHPKRNFVPTAVATKSGQVPVNAAKQSSPRAATSISTARPVNTAAPKPKVNDALPTTYSYFQAHSPGNGENAVKSSACWIWRPTRNVIDHISKDSGSYMLKRFDYGNPQYTLQDQGIFDSGCSRHMTGNKSFLTDYQEIDGGFVAFGGSPKGGKITRKGKIRTGKLDFKDVYFVKELKFNLFSVSQMCDKKNSVLFTETECLVLSPDFKLLDERGLTCLFAKATIDESNLWHRRLGHINFKTINKLVRGNLVRGLPSKLFENDHTCVACQKGKQHKASYPLGKFDGKADEGFLVGYFINSKDFTVFNTRTRRVEGNLHITFLENKLNVAGSGPDWLFDIDLLTNSMNYEPVTVGNQTNRNAEDAVAKDASKNTTEELANEGERYGQKKEGGALNKEGDQNVQDLRAELDILLVQQKEAYANSTNRVSTVSPSVSAAGGAYDDEDVGAEADLNNLETTMNVYVDDIIFGSIKKSLCVKFKQMMHKRFQISSIGELTFFLRLQVKQKDDGIFISQDKYVADILKKFDFVTVKTTSTPIETNKALLKDEEAEDVDVNLYGSMIGSLMYLTASRPDIMFVVCVCARFQVTSKVSHLHAVKRIFRYLKGQLKLGLWYPRDSPFDLEAFSDSDYAGASLDRKSTTGGCQFLGKRLISWQCKKQTIVVNSTTEVEYVAAANCCGQVLWIQNQMLDYGFNFMNTKIHIDNESTICIVKNPVFHFKTKHIEIRHHFIRDFYEKRLIQVIKIHTDHNVADLLTKAFDFVDQHNMVACLERTEGNADFHQIVDFLNASTISGPPKKVGDEAIYTGEDDRVVRAATTASSLEAEQESGNIHKTRSTATLNELYPQGTSSGSGPRCQDTTLGDTDAQTSGEDNMEHQDDLMDFIPPTPHDSPLSGGHTPRSDEGIPNINELMAICTNLSNRILALKTSKTAQDLVINKLKKKVKRLEKKQRERTPRMKLFKIGTSRRTSLDKENVAKQGRNLKTRPMFEEGYFDDDFYDIDDMVNEAMENIEGDTVNTATTGVSAASASVTTASKLYEREQKWINDFIPMDSEVVKNSRKGKAEGSKKKIVARKRTGDDEAVNVESIATKYPIVDWKTHVLSEDKMYYEIIRGDRSTKFYKIFTEMLDDFGRQDVLDLYRLVKERFETASPEGYDRLLWGDLIIVFEPKFMYMMNTGIYIHKLIEKTYPLTQEMLSRMLSRRLEVDYECEMAYELLRGGLLGIRGFYNLMLLVQVCANLKEIKIYSEGINRDEAFLHMLCILDGFLDVSFKSVKLVKFLVYLVSIEKVKALGAKGEVSGSRVRVVWMVVYGGNIRARLVSKVVAKGIFIGGFWVEELALDAMEYDDQDKWNEEDDLQDISLHLQNWKDMSRDDWYGPKATMCEEEESI